MSEPDMRHIIYVVDALLADPKARVLLVVRWITDDKWLDIAIGSRALSGREQMRERVKIVLPGDSMLGQRFDMVVVASGVRGFDPPPQVTDWFRACVLSRMVPGTGLYVEFT